MTMITTDHASSHRIQVAIRVRPLTSTEVASGETCSWLVRDQTITELDLPGNRLFTKKRNQSEFRFQHVFGPSQNTQAIYDELVSPIVYQSLCGVNGAVFCYGQTSAGKTYTCQGNEDQPGIIPIAIKNIFNHIREDNSHQYTLKCSYIEVYKEHVFDLLSETEQNLSIQEDKERVTIRGLIEESVMTEDRAFELFTLGLSNRKVRQTFMNEHSSRSHCIWRLSIERRLLMPTGTPRSHSNILFSQLNFVDLAGSERISRSTGSDTFKEGTSINKSLLSLGTVISALSQGLSHAPFRDSRLTLILKNCLGGNSRTAFIQCITPARSCIDESISTFRLAYRIANVTNCAYVNEILSDPHSEALSSLREKYQKLQMEHEGNAKANTALKRENRLLQIQLHQCKTLYMRTQEENIGERSIGETDRQESEERILQLNSVIGALKLKVEQLEQEKSTSDLRNTELEEALSALSLKFDGIKYSANMLSDLVNRETCSRRLQSCDDLSELEVDLYSALRAVITYRSQKEFK